MRLLLFQERYIGSTKASVIEDLLKKVNSQIANNISLEN